MRIQPVTQQVERMRPLSRTCDNACLVHIYPTSPATGTRHHLKKGAIVLGRADDCDIIASDSSVSRRHALFELDLGGYVVTDLESTNGTFINDTPTRRTPLSDGDYLRVGNCLYRYLAGRDVEAQYHEELYRLAIHDPLTGLYNKRYLVDYLQREIGRSSRYHRPLSLIVLDIDHFRVINDTMGRLAGDLALRDLGDCLRANVCEDDLVARFGEEEFAAVLTETDRVTAARLADHLRRTVEERAFRFAGRRYTVTISLGVASIHGDEAPFPEELIRRADDCLYRAKREGRNCVMS